MKRYYRQETQREKDAIYAAAVANCTPRRLLQRAEDEAWQRNKDAAAGRLEHFNARVSGLKARILWTTKNQNRLIRVFA